MDIPVIVVKKMLDGILDMIQNDYTSKIHKEKTWLYQVLNGNEIEGFNFYNQGVSVFTRTQISQRKIQVRFAFEKERLQLPNIIVRLSSDDKQGVNTIGYGVTENGFIDLGDGNIVNTVFRGFGQGIELMFTSSSMMETVLIYETMYAAIIAHINSFSNVFQNLEIGGRDLPPINQESFILYPKSIILKGTFRREVPEMTSINNTANSINFQENIV